LAAAVHYLIITFERSQEAERRALELKVLAQEAELRTLKVQIDPHFLFNSLNSVSALIGSDAGRARGMCLRLSEFLRSSLALADRGRIPLSEELAMARNYLEIEQVRFGPRLAVELSIASGAEACLVPPLLLQPLIENAVKHGVASLLDGGTIAIQAVRTGDTLRVKVENPCDAEAPQGRPAGVGLDNIRKRLRTLHGSDGRIDIARQAGKFSVILSIPCRRHGEPDGGMTL
ncbi:MAG: histidine kinase, partial [Acidobacteriota bacterium]